MTIKKSPRPRREDALSRERIIEAAIELLDSGGESGLTFRALAQRLYTGAGAIYGHIANKSDLLAAACDAIFARTVDVRAAGESPKAVVRAVALAMFDAMDAHPWVGSALSWAAGQMTMVRILERIGQQVDALGVPEAERWAAVSALLNYVLGVGGQNAGNAQRARVRGAERSAMLGAAANVWSQLDQHEYPFVRSVAVQMGIHDDRVDFLVGVDLILAGLESRRLSGGAEPGAKRVTER